MLTLLPSDFLQTTLHSTLFSYIFSVPQNALVWNYQSVQAVFLHQWTNQLLYPPEKSSKMSFVTLKATENTGTFTIWGKKITNTHAGTIDRIGFQSVLCIAKCTLMLSVTSSPPPTVDLHTEVWTWPPSLTPVPQSSLWVTKYQLKQQFFGWD